MWDSVQNSNAEYQAAIQRQNELMSTDLYWGYMRRHGSGVFRWTGDKTSALSILESVILSSERDSLVILRIQHELIDEQKDLHDTSTGQSLAKQYGAVWQHLREELETLRHSYLQARREQNQKLADSLRIQRDDLHRQLCVVETAQRELQETSENFLSEKTALYQRRLRDAQDDHAELTRTLADSTTEFEELSGKLQKNQKDFEEATRHYQNERAQTEALTKQEQLDQVQDERKCRYKQEQEEIEMKRQNLTKDITRGRKREVFKRNVLALLGVLAGVGTIAAGSATMQIPIVAVGIGLVGTAATKLDFSRKKKKEEDDIWDVPDYS
ncbi:hypothetical protein DL770_005262 [Monosporascus sp. CRB-9-2]|nr:hypothetical protein DL770_005262 [Monosporascus sp. CRB-9-2]